MGIFLISKIPESNKDDYRKKIAGDYKSKKAVLADLKKNMDFIFNNAGNPYDGKPCSPNDFKGKDVKVRYNNLRMVFIHNQGNK